MASEKKVAMDDLCMMNNENKKNNRRKFLGNITKVTLAGATVPLMPVTGMPKKKPIPFGFLCVPYLQNLTQDSVHLIFLTNADAYSWIEYGEDNLDLKAETRKDGFMAANNHVNRIELQQLKPDTSYKYRVVSREIVKFDPYDLIFGETIQGDVHTFRTPAEDSKSVSCLILNDIHDRPYSFADLLSLNKDFEYDFVALNGDMFDYQTDEQQLIDHLITPCTSLFASEIPFLFIRGNHETRGKFARNIKDYFAFAHNEYYFSFKQGPVHWIVLDSGEDKPDDDKEYSGIVCFDAFREMQADWLEKEFQKPKFHECKYRVVLMHIPPFYSGDRHGTMHCRKLFHPLFERYKVDMVVSGHTHTYGVHPPSKEHNYPIIIGGGPRTGNRTLIQLKADGSQLRIKTIRDDGEIVGEYKI